MGGFRVVAIFSLCFIPPYLAQYGSYQQNQTSYGESQGASYQQQSANYTMPQYPSATNQSYSMRNNSYQANYYAQDPFAWDWDREHRGRHVYNTEAHQWINENMQAAWDFATNWVDGQNNQYNSNQQCGYSGNPYDSTETRNQKRGEILTHMAQWLWDNYPNPDKLPLHKAMLNVDPYQHWFLRDCLAENYDQWKGTCQQYDRYSRPDQICNNWDFPTWGSVDDIGVRITDIWNYEGGIWRAMKYQTWPSYDGSVQPLMNEKQLADLLDKTSADCYNLNTTMLHATFVQTMTHDLVKSAPYTVTGAYGEQGKPKCCSVEGYCQHHSCSQVYGPAGGDGYNSYGQTCLEKIDNVPGIDYCHPQAKDPRNLQTAYLDASFIYGATCEKAASLRSYRKGKLQVNKGYYGLYSRNILLPDDPKPDPWECDTNYASNDQRCMKAGDIRANQHPALTGWHTVWLRLHNRIAASCSRYLEKQYLAEEVIDEVCYQESRRFIQAVIQNIFYSHVIPHELGPYVGGNPQYGLSLDYPVPYNPNVHTSIWPEYTYAAGRLHTLVSHWTQVNDPNRVAQGWTEPQSWYNINEFLGRGYGLTYSKNKFNELFGNQLYDPEQCYDTSFVAELRGGGAPGGSAYGGSLDMLTMNIARGREFGIPWYNQIREFCGMSPIYDWGQLEGSFHQHCMNTLPGVYGHVNNIEAYVGMICETPMPGALVGPTSACILARQYQNVREGDRWFFDRNGFTSEQMGVIKKLNLGKILCITTNLDYVTENVFRTPNYETNKYVTCNSYDDVTEDDLSILWTTLPTYNSDYRTCKEYDTGYGGSGGYQNQTYSAPSYGNSSYGQQMSAAYTAPSYGNNSYGGQQSYGQQSYGAPSYSNNSYGQQQQQYGGQYGQQQQQQYGQQSGY